MVVIYLQTMHAILMLFHIWFDNKWWRENLNCDAPGYIGSGCGIPLGGKYSSLGYSIKNPDKKNYEKAFFF